MTATTVERPRYDRLRAAWWLVLACAAALRLVGLGWGLPDANHLRSYHPDEWQMAGTALSMVLAGDPNPHFFNYPSLGIYLTAALFAPVSLLVPPAPANLGFWVLLARLLSAAAGLAAVWWCGRLGRELGGERIGLLAGALLGVLPLAAVNSHFATVDMLLTAWCALGLWAAVRLGQGCDRRWLVTGAVALGLATATKYNGALLAAPLLVGVALGAPCSRRLLAAAAVVGGGAAVFAVCSPFVLLDWSAAWPQIRFELIEHPRASNLFVGLGPAWWFQLAHNLPTAAGYVVPSAALLGLVLTARRRATWPLLLWAALVGLSLARTAEFFIRYWLPLLPAVAVWASLGAAAASRALRHRVPPRWVPVLPWLVAALLLLGSAARSGVLSAMLARPDARDAALAWCRANLPAGASVGELGRTWFWSVPLRINNSGQPLPGPADESRWRLADDPAAWAAEPPEWLVINDTKRLLDFAGREAEWDRLTAGYERVASFANQATLPGWRETGVGSRQHDWLYILPQIDIYRRRPEPAPSGGP